MSNVLVRNLDDAVVEEHKRRARDQGISLEEQLRRVLAEAATPTLAEILEDMARIRAMTPSGPRTSAEDLIREIRDE